MNKFNKKVFLSILLSGLVLMSCMKRSRFDEPIALDESLRYERPVLRGVTMDGNGAKIYQQLLRKKIPSFDTGFRNLYDKKNYHIKANSFTTGKYISEINQMREATRYKYIQFTFKKDDLKDLVNRNKSPLLDNYVHFRQIAKLAVSYAVEKYKKGRTLEALEIFLDVIRFGQDIGSQGTFIAAMVGNNIGKSALDALGHYIHNKSYSSEVYQKFLPQLKSLYSNGTDFQELLIYELKLAHKLLLPKDQNGRTRAWYKQVLEEPELNQQKQMIKDAQFLGEHRMWFQGGENRLKASQSVLKGLYIQTLLHQYKMKKGQFPDNLSQLNTELPLDPFSQKPFIYKLKNKGFSLYSVGRNKADDKGIHRHYYKKGKNLDIVIQ